MASTAVSVGDKGTCFLSRSHNTRTLGQHHHPPICSSQQEIPGTKVRTSPRLSIRVLAISHQPSHSCSPANSTDWGAVRILPTDSSGQSQPPLPRTKPLVNTTNNQRLSALLSVSFICFAFLCQQNSFPIYQVDQPLECTLAPPTIAARARIRSLRTRQSRK